VIEVLYMRRGCPHADGLRDHIEQLVSQHGFDERVEARCIDSDAQARAEHFLGSPTVRINGRDVDPTAGERHAYGLACRIYPRAEGTLPDDWILAALNGMKTRVGRFLSRPTMTARPTGISDGARTAAPGRSQGWPQAIRAATRSAPGRGL
jgi:hypothetical protein